MDAWKELQSRIDATMKEWSDEGLIFVLHQRKGEWRVRARLGDSTRWLRDPRRHLPPVHAIATNFRHPGEGGSYSAWDFTITWVMNGPCKKCDNAAH